MRFKKGNRWKSSKSEVRYKTWRKIVFELNKRKRGVSKFYVCEKCNKRRKTTRVLHAHHIYSWEKYPDKRYDRSTSGLCLFIYPSGIKVFCAIKKFSMYNKKKNRTEKNAVYKKIFRMEDHPQRDYAAAKLELPNVLSLMGLPKEKKDEKF